MKIRVNKERSLIWWGSQKKKIYIPSTSQVTGRRARGMSRETNRTRIIIKQWKLEYL